MLTVLAHPDPERVGQRAWLAGAETPLSRATPDFGDGGPLRDPFISRKPVRITRSGALGVTISGKETRTGLRLDGVEVTGATTLAAARLAGGVVLELAGRVALLLHRRRTADEVGPTLGLLGVSEGIERLRREVLQVADLDVPVLVRGESGVGKELVARALHGGSPRKGAAYAAVNMAAVPSTLAASELFGHVRGAFSGAAGDRDGYFAQADGGTLFLDEVGDTPMDVQAMLLRALATGEIRPVGGPPRRVDVRVLAATDADLEASVTGGDFRAPLLHRLAGYRIDVPPLRTRREDIALLLYHFVAAELSTLGRALSGAFVPAALVTALTRYGWPGNVRELRNVARQLVIANRDAEVMEWSDTLSRLVGPEAPPDPERARYRKPDAVDEDELVAALKAHGFRLKPTAQALGVSRTALYGLIERSDRVRKATDLGRDEVRAALSRHGGDVQRAAERLKVSRQALAMRMNQLGIER